MTKVSIIIPVYNVEKYIRQALDSIVNQTLQNIEIICINDCTPDDSFEIVKEYASKDNRFVLLEQESNQGQGVARNRGLDIATGEYIMFLDPDDWYELNTCELAYNQISANNNEIVYFDLNKHYQKNKRYKSIYNIGRLKQFESISTNQHINWAKYENIQLPAAFTVVQIYSRNFLNENNIRYSEERFAEDLHFFIKSWVTCKDVSILNKALYNYRITSSKTFDYASHFNDVLTSKDKASKIIYQSENKEIYLKQFLPYRINSDIYWLKSFSHSNRKIRNMFFNKVKESFKSIEQEFSSEILCRSYRYGDFLIILDSKSYEEYRLKKLFYKILRLKKGL